MVPTGEHVHRRPGEQPGRTHVEPHVEVLRHADTSLGPRLPRGFRPGSSRLAEQGVSIGREDLHRIDDREQVVVDGARARVHDLVGPEVKSSGRRSSEELRTWSGLVPTHFFVSDRSPVSRGGMPWEDIPALAAIRGGVETSWGIKPT